jgi:hypothetical protein
MFIESLGYSSYSALTALFQRLEAQVDDRAAEQGTVVEL